MATPSKRSTPKKTVQKNSTGKKREHSSRRSCKKRNRSKRKKRGVKGSKALLFRRGIIGLVFLGFLVAVGYGYFMTEKKGTLPEVVDREVIYPYSQDEILKELAKIKTRKPESKTRKPESERSRSSIEITKKHIPSEKSITVPNSPEQLKKKILFKERGSEVVEDRQRDISEISHEREAQRKIALAYRSKRPKLVIIIDDVHTPAQLAVIRSLPLHVTPSIFPPYTQAKHSERLAKGLKHFMIHLPMESGSAKFNSQTKTLMTSFSKAQMHTRAKELRKLFPHAVYINNHTGSVFTKNYKAMKSLYEVLKVEGFVFVDSFTIGSSKVKAIAHEAGDAYVRRDIFIDNKPDISYIHTQLKKAVNLAKRNGYAIAIGHPHKRTIEALRSAKPILKDVDVVYIDEIYQRR